MMITIRLKTALFMSSKYSKEAQGIMWTLVFCVSFPLLTGVVRHLTDLGLASPQIVFIRNLAAVLLMVPFIFLRKERLDMKIRNRNLYFLRIIVGLTSMMLWFYGLGRLPLATATALSFSTPIFTALTAVIFLREKMGVRRWAAVIIGFTGTMIILRPDVAHFNLPAAAVLSGCFFMSIALIIVKKLTNTETPFNMMFHMHLWMAVFSIPIAFMHWESVNLNEIYWCVLLAALSIMGHYALARAYTLVDVTLTLPFDFTRLIIASVVAYFAFNEVPDVYAYIGSGIIIASSIFIAHREAKLRKALKMEREVEQ